MEIKAELLKPYTEQEEMDFLLDNQNYPKNYDIRETEEALQAWGYTDEEIAEQEAEKIQKLALTKREVFLALYDDKGITPEQLRAQITDVRAGIEFDYADKYFRFNPLIDSIGALLGYSSEDLDYLFINKEFPPKGE